MTDDEVMMNLQRNRQVEETIRFLYRENYEFVSRYILQNNGSEQDAEDIFQEVIIAFIAVVQQGKFRGEASIRTFLYTMNRNMWLNELKKRGRANIREAKYEQMTERTESGLPQMMESRQVHEQLMGLLDEVGDTCKKILLLFYFENMPMKEILSHLHYENEQVVRNKKHKCIKKLEQLIRGNENLYQQLKTVLHG